MSNPSLTVNAGDFDELKQGFKTFLQSLSAFSDYNLDGPVVDQLLSLLAYNSYLNVFYDNMAVNETFMDTAFQRDSIVSRAKELNYTPRSFKSAVATVDISIYSSNLSRSSIIIPKGTLFVSRVGDRSYSFTTNRTVITTSSVIEGSKIKFTASDVELYEGHYVSESVPYTGAPIIIQNQQIDISSISVASLEDAGGTTVPYKRVQTLYDVGPTSAIYFIEGATNSRYQVRFGNDIFGRTPKAGSVVSTDYRISNGELPNGAKDFRAGQSIDGETDIVITCTLPANSGAVHESEESIQFNAPRHFSTQERAVVPVDYSNLLRENFPELVDVVSFGGEEMNPPRYGAVGISAVLNGVDYLPLSKQTEFKSFLKGRTMMTPLFIEPQYIYINVKSNVKFDPSLASLNADDIKTLVVNAIDSYSSVSLNHFGKGLRFSRLTSTIDAADRSILSNDTSITLSAIANETHWRASRFTIGFNAPVSSMYSDAFSYRGASCKLVDNNGIIEVKSLSADRTILTGVGSVDYASGSIQLTGFKPDALETVNIYAVPVNKDIEAATNSILKIRNGDIAITMTRGT